MTLFPLPRLGSPDQGDILGRRWLSDDVIDLAQEVLQRQFSNTVGLYAVGGDSTLPPLQAGNRALFLQIENRSTQMSLTSMADYGSAGAVTAFTFSIAHGQDSCRLRYMRDRMAHHLVSCLERGTVTPFPSEPQRDTGINTSTFSRQGTMLNS